MLTDEEALRKAESDYQIYGSPDFRIGFRAAIEWLRSQAEPIGEMSQDEHGEWSLHWNRSVPFGAKLFLTPQPAHDDREYLAAIALLGSAMRRLVIAARTSGGTAGPDDELMAACTQAEDAMSLGAIGLVMEATQSAEQSTEKLSCGHPTSLLLRSAETGDPLYCELCDAQSARRDAESMETSLRAELDALRSQGEPVAWMNAKKEMTYFGHYNPDDVPLFLAPQPTIPDGWKLVPTEPTPEMVKAMQDTFWTGKSTYSLRTTDAYRVFFAMLAAAPEPKAC